VIGLLTAIAVPAFTGYLRSSRLQGSRNQLISDIYYTRSLAIAQRKTFAIHFQDDQYQIVDTTNGTVVRTTPAAPGVTFAATADPNFYAWGLSDASDITIANGSLGSKIVSVLPTGSVDHAN
jgi:Tfp pilus assembly protein FimT